MNKETANEFKLKLMDKASRLAESLNLLRNKAQHQKGLFY